MNNAFVAACLLAASVATTPHAFAQRQNLLFPGNVPNADPTFSAPSSLWPFALEKPSNNPGAISIAPIWSNSAAKFELDIADNKVAGGKRAELRMPAEPLVKCERWYGISIFLPSNYASDTNDENVMQWHDTPDPAVADNPATPINETKVADSSSRSPSMSMSIKNGRWYLWIMWSAKDRNHYADGGVTTIDLGRHRTNGWTRFVFHIKSSWEPDGLVEVWRDGTKVVNHSGPNSYNDQVGKYFKMGIYKWLWNNHDPDDPNDPNDTFTPMPTVNHRMLYIDEFRVGNQFATYADVVPDI